MKLSKEQLYAANGMESERKANMILVCIRRSASNRNGVLLQSEYQEHMKSLLYN